jgi:hemoglobin-like flavoprotein
MLTGMNLSALETSFDLVAPHGDELVERFYSDLFAAAPAVIPMFANTDMVRQRQMLLSALVLLRRSLRNLEAIVPALRRMGARHVAYGARSAHYPTVGAVLIGAMAEVVGEAWTPEYTQAWSEAFELVAQTMIEGAAEVRIAAAA